MLNRPRRQVAATLALGVFSIAPTAYIAQRAHHLQRPAHLREVEAEFGRRLGVLASVSSASHPRPDVDLLKGVALRLDDAHHAQIARADEIRITRDGPEMTVKVDRLDLLAEDASDALSRVLSVVLRLATTEVARVNLVADRCDLHLGDSVETIQDLAVICGVDRALPSLSASYLVGDERKASRTRCEISIRREKGDAGVRTSLTLKTLDGSIPARLLDPIIDMTTWLGSTARLDGDLALTRVDGEDWNAEFQGEFTDVDLATVVGRRFAGHRMTGVAKLVFESARWSERPGGQGPGWVQARGTVSSGPGSISTGLLKALESRMRFRLGSPSNSSRTDVDFQAMGLSFAMDDQGELILKGGLGGEYAPDAVLIEGQRTTPLARSPQGAANVRGLWNTLIPAPAESLAPAVPEAHALRYLPLPPGRPGPISAN